jgi:hypothetical protein
VRRNIMMHMVSTSKSVERVGPEQWSIMNTSSSWSAKLHQWMGTPGFQGFLLPIGKVSTNSWYLGVGDVLL